MKMSDSISDNIKGVQPVACWPKVALELKFYGLQKGQDFTLSITILKGH